MGFGAAAARRALQSCQDDVEAAIEQLACDIPNQGSPSSPNSSDAAAQQQQGGGAGGGGGGAAEAVRVVGAVAVPLDADRRNSAMEIALENLVLAGGSVAVPLVIPPLPTTALPYQGAAKL